MPWRWSLTLQIKHAMPNQDYYVKVTATCSNGSTSSAVENVYTPCEIIETQWFDDFSDETYGCWEVYNAGDSNTWTLETIFEDGSAPSLSHSKIAEPMLKNKPLAEGIAKAHPLKRLGEGKDSAALDAYELAPFI